jgi:DNA-binding transcriptional regulator YdaS (Cro superfamily)
MSGKIYLAYRNISGTDNVIGKIFPGLKAGHAWIMVKDPDTGDITSYSGKSGIVFTKMAFMKRYGLGRDDTVDEVFSKMYQKYVDGNVTLDELKVSLADLDWENLTKAENWGKDTFDNATTVIEIMPRKGDTQNDIYGAIENIKRAFQNYSNDVPYDPMPGTEKSGNLARNSNSFAYTLLRNIFNDGEVRRRTGNLTMKLPGWGQIVRGMSSKPQKRNESIMKITCRQLRQIIKEELQEQSVAGTGQSPNPYSPSHGAAMHRGGDSANVRLMKSIVIRLNGYSKKLEDIERRLVSLEASRKIS